MKQQESMKQEPRRPESKTKLLDAALHVIRSKGYAATTVDDICQAAGVSKGSFFYHFDTKEQLAIEAAEHFGDMARGLFATASYRNVSDPIDRVLGYIDFRIDMLEGALPEFSCLLGTMVQEVYDTHPQILAACERELGEHAADVAKDIEAARSLYAPSAAWSAESLAVHMQAVLQGAFVLAKAKQGPQVAVECLTHLRRYVEMLFPSEENRKPKQLRGAHRASRR
jgi:TetR/AcrR family transcriptional repressor of nem operon